MADAAGFISTPSSSHIAGFSYDPSTDTLTVEFVDGSSYDYLNVPASVARQFEAEKANAGRFFHRQIKGRYSYEPA